MINTTIGAVNHGKCPYWDIDVSVFGWYGEKQSGKWEFLRAECPIVENAKRPMHEQIPEYKLMYCKDKFACPLYTRFQPSTTLDNQ